jgi:hypothetical protein
MRSIRTGTERKGKKRRRGEERSRRREGGREAERE